MKNLLVLLLALPIGLFAQDSYEVKRGEIVFKNFIQNDVNALKTVNDAQYKTIVIDKVMGQEAFDLLCANFSWATRLELNSRNKNISDISAISNLNGLEEIELQDLMGSKENPLDLNVFSKLNKLKKLYLRGVKVKNTESLANNTMLEELVLFKSDASSLDFLASTPELKKLDLFGNTVIKDYSPLAQLKKLEELNLSFNSDITDAQLAPLSSISSLKEINIGFCGKLTSLNFLENNTGLTYINMSGCRDLSNFTALSKITTLTFVNGNKTQLKSLEHFANNKSIENFKIRGTQVSDIEVLRECSRLRELDLSDTPITSLEPLALCQNLKKVDLINCGVKNITPLGESRDLNSLNLTNTQVTDIKALANCSKLTYLDIQETAINDLSPLLEGDKLRRLTVGDKIPAEQLEELKQKFPKMKLIVAN